MRKAVLLACALLAGCFSSSSPTPPDPDARDKLNFDVLTQYYCEQKDWPETLDAVRGWARDKAVIHELDTYVDAKTSSPRKILFTIDYLPDEASQERRTVAFIAPPRCDAEQKEIDPAHVSMAGGGITFTLSPEFAPLDADQMRERWGDGPYPDVAWESAQGKLLVSARFGEVDASSDHLKALQAPLEAAYAQSAKGFTWKVRKFGKINETPWIRLAYESDSTKGRLFNTSLTTTFKGKLFTLSFTSPANKEKELSLLSKEVLQSISISQP